MEMVANSPEEMIKLGAEAACSASSGAVFGLVGTLGAGKTHWTKGFLGKSQPTALVTSPTFSLINEYKEGHHPVFHFDFYRLKSSGELLDLGWDEYLDSQGVVICEWADRFPEMMPENTIWLEFTCQPNGSRLVQTVSKPMVAAEN